MSSAVRLLAATTVAAACLVVGAQQAVAAPPEVQWRTPAVEQRFSTSDFVVDATVRMPNDGTLRGNVTLSFASPEGHPVPGALEFPTGNAASRAVTHPVSFPWNGPYTVRIGAVGRDSVVDRTDEPIESTRQFAVDAPPAPPTGVRTSVDGDTRHVTVSWQANAEPDMVGYEVQRQLGARAWEHVDVTGTATTTVVDEAPASAGGTYRYRVFALRESATPGGGIASGPSSTSSAKVPAPPVTTTTTAPPDDDDGGGDTDDGEETTGGTTGGRTGGGSRTSTTTRGGATTEPRTGSTATGGRRISTPALATRGRVDLSGFAKLLQQARASSSTTVPEPDGPFSERLPFAPRQRTTDDTADDDRGGEVVTISTPIEDDGGNRIQSMAFLAGGLLATVLLMHVLLVRSELRRAEQLEALAPAAGASPVEEAQPAAPAPGLGAEPPPDRPDAWGRHLASTLARFHARPPARRPAELSAPADEAAAGAGRAEPVEHPEHAAVG